MTVAFFAGTNQSGNGFYRRLHQYFAENCGGNCSRSQNSIQNRWLTIQKAVSRFSALYSAIERRNESGKNEQDRVWCSKFCCDLNNI